jgi:PTS system nitrogen regulatory IIA component
MHLVELLAPDRVAVHKNGATHLDKPGAIHQLSSMLARGVGMRDSDVERVLLEREALQSTGIGEGVAIPHGALSELEVQCGSVLLVPGGVPFEAIDGHDVTILVAVIGPKRASGEHLKTLARVSRLLRSREFRDRLLTAEGGAEAYAMLVKEEGERR